MTDGHEQHLDSIVEAFTEACIAKYRKGVEEYGTNLWEYSPEALLDEAINEAVDQFVYLMTLKQQLQNKYHQLTPVED